MWVAVVIVMTITTVFLYRSGDLTWVLTAACALMAVTGIHESLRSGRMRDQHRRDIEEMETWWKYPPR